MSVVLIFRKSLGNFQPHDITTLYSFAASIARQYPLQLIYSTLRLSRSSYYEWKHNKTHQLSKKDLAMNEKVLTVFHQHKRRYGARRIARELDKQHFPISPYKTRRLMVAGGLHAIQPRSFIPRTTDSRHNYSISPNLLKDRPLPTSLNNVWVGDITYIPLTGGSFRYLSVWMDLCSRKVVGWDLQNHMRESLVRASLQKALSRRRITAPLIIHSDRGRQYGANNFRRLLNTPLLSQSMSGRDNPYDNAHMESCFSRLKAELLQGRAFRDADYCRREIFDYIEMYYNPFRLHSSLGYMSPQEYEKKIYENQTG